MASTFQFQQLRWAYGKYRLREKSKKQQITKDNVKPNIKPLVFDRWEMGKGGRVSLSCESVGECGVVWSKKLVRCVRSVLRKGRRGGLSRLWPVRTKAPKHNVGEMELKEPKDIPTLSLWKSSKRYSIIIGTSFHDPMAYPHDDSYPRGYKSDSISQ